ncbi:MAG: nucleotidyltransferase domain-containing protein [Candidatus Hermodarchaeota archaeon]
MKLLELAKLLKNRVVKLFPNKIAVVVLYGSTAQGKDDKFSDLDIFAILDNKEESNLPWEFIFQDHTIDFWKMDWQEAECLASGKVMSSPWAVSASLFVNSRILYTRSESDKNRFELLVEKTKRFEEENLKQILKEFNSGYSHIEIIKLTKKNNDLLSARWAI